MAASPVDYVRSARLNGSVFDKSYDVCYDSTNFRVDQKEPREVLESVVEKGRGFRLGQLPYGCEYLAVVDGEEGRGSGSKESEELERWQSVSW